MQNLLNNSFVSMQTLFFPYSKVKKVVEVSQHVHVLTPKLLLEFGQSAHPIFGRRSGCPYVRFSVSLSTLASVCEEDTPTDDRI